MPKGGLSLRNGKNKIFASAFRRRRGESAYRIPVSASGRRGGGAARAAKICGCAIAPRVREAARRGKDRRALREFFCPTPPAPLRSRAK